MDVGETMASEIADLQYRVESVDTALRLLLLLHDDPDLRVTIVARRLGIAPSTAHRLLTTLARRGFLVQDRVTKIYRAGPALVELGVRSTGSFGLREVSEPHLRRLTARIGETANVVVRIGAYVRFIVGFEGDQQMRTHVITGVLLPAYATSGGKVLLAGLAREELRKLYPGGLKKLTTQTLTFTRLVDELSLVTMRGFAVNDGESDPMLRAVAVPLKDAAGRTIAAIATSSRTSHLSEDRIAKTVMELRDCAARIREDLPPNLTRT